MRPALVPARTEIKNRGIVQTLPVGWGAIYEQSEQSGILEIFFYKTYPSIFAFLLKQKPKIFTKGILV